MVARWPVAAHRSRNARRGRQRVMDSTSSTRSWVYGQCGRPDFSTFARPTMAEVRGADVVPSTDGWRSMTRLSSMRAPVGLNNEGCWGIWRCSAVCDVTRLTVSGCREQRSRRSRGDHHQATTLYVMAQIGEVMLPHVSHVPVLVLASISRSMGGFLGMDPTQGTPVGWPEHGYTTD